MKKNVVVMYCTYVYIYYTILCRVHLFNLKKKKKKNIHPPPEEVPKTRKYSLRSSFQKQPKIYVYEN